VSDPFARVRDALEAGDRPRGKPYDFRSRCPVHDGDIGDSLHVGKPVERRSPEVPGTGLR